MSAASRKRIRRTRGARERDLSGSSTAASALASRLATALGAIARNLPNPADESTDYFRPFVASMPATVRLNGDTFHRALKIGARYRIDLSSADQLLSNGGRSGQLGRRSGRGISPARKSDARHAVRGVGGVRSRDRRRARAHVAVRAMGGRYARWTPLDEHGNVAHTHGRWPGEPATRSPAVLET